MHTKMRSQDLLFHGVIHAEDLCLVTSPHAEFLVAFFMQNLHGVMMVTSDLSAVLARGKDEWKSADSKSGVQYWTFLLPLQTLLWCASSLASILLVIMVIVLVLCMYYFVDLKYQIYIYAGKCGPVRYV